MKNKHTIKKGLRSCIAFSLFLLMAANGNAQNPTTRVFEEWNTTSGTQNSFQHSVVRSKTIGGTVYNYLAGATLNANGDYDMMVSKYTAAGALLWTQTYNGLGNGDDVAADVQIDAIGNVYITGSYYKNATDSNNAIIIKYSSAGTHRWTYTYNGAGSRHDAGFAMTAASNTILVCGTSWVSSTNKYDMLAIRVDSSGNQVWATTYDYLSLNDGAHNLYSRTGFLYVAGGVQSATTTYKYAVLKLSPVTGAISTTTITGGTGFGIDQVADIQSDNTGNIYITGSVLNVPSLYDFKTIKLDTDLNIVWSATYDGGNNLNDFGTGIKVDANSNVIVTGSSRTASNGNDYTTIKYNSSGTQLWVENFDGGINADDSATSIVINDTNHIYITGSSYNGSTNDYYTIRYDASGNQVYGIGFNSIENANDRASAIALDTNGNVIVTGQNKINDSTFTYTTVKYIEKSTMLPQDTIACPFTTFIYTENRGQLLDSDTLPVPEIRYYTRDENPAVFFSDTAVSYVIAKFDTAKVSPQDSVYRVDMKFINANAGIKIRAMEQRSEYSSFFYPHCSDGISRVQDYDKLISFNVWNKVDVIYGSNTKGLKYYFVCKPLTGGGSSSQIDLKYEGADSVKIDGSGQLIIYTKIGTIVQPKAAAWQIDGSGNYSSLGWQPSYTLLATNEVGFTGLGSYNTALPLIIAVDWGSKATSTQAWNTNNVWSTFVQGSHPNDNGMGITNDNFGNTFVVGTTESLDFPVSTGGVFQTSYNGFQDAFCTKFNSLNDIDWCTYIGGYATDVATDVKLKSNGNLVLFGFTLSDDFPMSLPPGVYQNTNNVVSDRTLFLFELDVNGLNNMWSTYFGGTEDETANLGTHLVIDQYDYVSIAAMTGSDAVTQNFPIYTLANAYNQGTYGGHNTDGFVASFDNTRNLIWCTYFGGNNPDDLLCIALVGEDILIGGKTFTTATNTTCAGNTSGGFPICNGGYYQSANQGLGDGFIARFDFDRALIWSTFFGGSGDDYVTSIIATNNKIFIAGSTESTTGQITANQCSPTTNGTFPTCDPGGGATFVNSNAGSSDIFMAAFDDATHALLWSTFYGGTGLDFVQTITTDGSDVFLGGFTKNGGFNAVAVDPGNNYYYQQNNANTTGFTSDPLIIEFNSNLAVTWATHYGGSSAPVPTFNDEQIRGVSVSAGTKLYVTGTAATTNFPYRCDPATAYCFEETPSTYMNLQDAFVAEFDLTGGVGIDDYFVHQTDFNLFPNPAVNTITINLGNAVSEDEKFVIYNAVGQIVFSLDLSSMQGISKFDIDVSNFATGFYVAQYITSDGVASKKFMKQ